MALPVAASARPCSSPLLCFAVVLQQGTGGGALLCRLLRAGRRALVRAVHTCAARCRPPSRPPPSPAAAAPPRRLQLEPRRHLVFYPSGQGMLVLFWRGAAAHVSFWATAVCFWATNYFFWAYLECILSSCTQLLISFACAGVHLELLHAIADLFCLCLLSAAVLSPLVECPVPLRPSISAAATTRLRKKETSLGDMSCRPREGRSILSGTAQRSSTSGGED